MTGQLYSGQPGNITNPGQIAISSTTSANPIQVTTSSPHGLTTGDWVNIFGHFGQTSANCVNKRVTVLSATTFTIPIDGTANPAGGISGSVVPRSYALNVATLPADGDAYAAATYVPGYAAALDRSAFERGSTGSLCVVGEITPAAAYGGSGPTTPWAALTGAPLANAWTQMLAMPGSGPTPTWTIPEVAIGDILICDLHGTMMISNASSGQYTPQIGLGWTVRRYDGVTPLAGSYAITGDKANTVVIPAVNWCTPISLRALIGVGINSTLISYPGTNTVGQLWLQPWVQGQGVGATISLVGDFTMQVRQWRPTGIGM
jgi:hypothetical protein